jgi:hypothetical protein
MLAALPALGASVAGVVSGKGLGGVTSDFFGSTNEFKADPYQVNDADYQLGGSPEAAKKMSDLYMGGAHRAGLESFQDRRNALGARNEQNSALGLMRQAAEGNAPSRAEILGRAQADQAASAQQSLAASARGPAALALAQQNAAANTANAQTQIATNAMGMRADEMAQARNAYMQGATGIRGQDITSQNAARAHQLGMLGLNQNADLAQLNAGISRSRDKMSAHNTAMDINAGVSRQNADTNYKAAAGMVDMAGKALGGDVGGGGGGGGSMGGAGGAAAGAGGGAGAGAGVAGGAGGLGAMVGLLSSEGTKRPALMASPGDTKDPYVIGADYGPGRTLAYDDNGRGTLASFAGGAAGKGTLASLGGMGGGGGESKAKTAPPAEPRKPTVEEADAWATKELERLRSELSEPPPTKPTQPVDLGAKADAEIAKTRAAGEAAKRGPSFVEMIRGAERDAEGGLHDLDRSAEKKVDSALTTADQWAGEKARGLASLFGSDNKRWNSAVQTGSGKTFPAPTPQQMEEYLASTRGSTYAYKDPSFPGANRGPNYGPPSAEDMAATPVGRIVTTIDPRTGMPAIDQEKAIKANMSGLSYVNDKLNATLAQLEATRRGKR